MALFSNLPGCSWFWQHLGHPGPIYVRKSPKLCSSNTPPPHTCPGSDKARPGYSAASPHLGGPCQAPGKKNQDQIQQAYIKGCLD